MVPGSSKWEPVQSDAWRDVRGHVHLSFWLEPAVKQDAHDETTQAVTDICISLRE